MTYVPEIIDNPPTTIYVATEVTLSPQFVADIFTTALEGGINYWATTSQYHWQHVDRSCDLFGFFAVINDEENDEQQHRVDRAVILDGLTRLAAGEVKGCSPDRRSAIVRATIKSDAGEIDADYADIIVQAGLFGEVVYG